MSCSTRSRSGGRQISSPRVESLDALVADRERPVDFALDEQIAGKRRLLKAPGFVQTPDRLGILDDSAEFADVSTGSDHGFGRGPNVGVMAFILSPLGFRFPRHPREKTLQVRRVGRPAGYMVPAEPVAYRFALEDLAKQVVLFRLKLVAVVALPIGVDQGQCSHRQVELAFAYAESSAHRVGIVVKLRKQPLHRPCAVDRGPPPLAGDVVEPHHDHVIAFVGVLVLQDGHPGEPRTVEPAEIDGVLLVPALQVLERRDAPVPLDHEKPHPVLARQDRIDVEPAVLLDAGDQIPDVLLVVSQHEAGRTTLDVRIVDVLPRDGPVLRVVREPEVVRVEVEAIERHCLPLAAHLFRGFVAHGSFLRRREDGCSVARS